MSEVYHAYQLPLFPSKVCTRCGIEKTLDQFGIARSCKDGRRSYCNICKRKREKEYARIYYASNADYRQKKVEQNKLNRAANRERICETRRNHYARHNEQIRQRRKEQYQADPQKALNYSRERKARLKKASTETINYGRILERDEYFCYICQQPIDPTVKEGPGSLAFDHVIPLSPRKGEPKGTHTEDNLKPTHKVCNNRKHNRRFEDMNAIQRRGITE